MHSTNEKPAQVYLTLKRKSHESSLALTSYGRLNKDTGLYEITVDISKDFEMHFNGEYEATLYAADYRGKEPIQWSLGNVKVWYKEGHDDGSNSGVK